MSMSITRAEKHNTTTYVYAGPLHVAATIMDFYNCELFGFLFSVIFLDFTKMYEISVEWIV